MLSSSLYLLVFIQYSGLNKHTAVVSTHLKTTDEVDSLQPANLYAPRLPEPPRLSHNLRFLEPARVIQLNLD